jgi:hypothetical protein
MEGTKPYRGIAVYLFAFDIAYEMGRGPVQTLFGQPVEHFKVDASKRNPRHPFFYRPPMVRLPPCKREGPYGPVEIERVVKLLPIGAISITASVPFEVEKLEDLVQFHDLQFGERSLYGEIRELAEKVYTELRPSLVRPVEYLADEEAYTVFCVETGPLLREEIPAEQWLNEHRREVAALLTQEPDLERLSDQEASESTARYLSYYQNDLVVIDWDAALVIDEPKDFSEELYIMELGNLHLAELEAYDRLLDRSLERSYRDLASRAFRRRSEVLYELREIRIDLTRYSDELSNITKFFGDWHLARIYETIASRFHLPDWHRNVKEKLKTLDQLYQLLHDEQSNRWMLILEITIVLLFIIDLVILFMGLK